MEGTETRVGDATRVLVIEDDRHLRDLLEVVLEEDQDLEVTTLADERRAVEAFRDLRPDVVVLDVKLPHLSGDEVAAQLRSVNPGVRIVSLSGFEPDHRPWADAQVVKTADLMDDLRKALRPDRPWDEDLDRR